MSSVDVRAFAANGEDGAADRLDADMRHVLDVLAGMGGKPIERCRTSEARAQPTLDMALQRILRQPQDDPAAHVELRTFTGAAGELGARVYAPGENNDAPRPLVLYLHGGGFVVGDLDRHDATPRGLAERTGAIVVSAHYRQAPEYRFPAAHEDAAAAWQWLAAEAEALGGDPARIAIVGEGSGANLAINVALDAADGPGPRPVHLGLVSPMAAMQFDLPSHLEDTESGPLRTQTLKWASRKMFRRREDMRDARMNVADRADLGRLSPTTIILPQADPLRSEGEALAGALRRAGVWVDMTVYEGVTHGFFGLHQIVNKAMFAHSQMAGNLVAAFGG